MKPTKKLLSSLHTAHDYIDEKIFKFSELGAFEFSLSSWLKYILTLKIPRKTAKQAVEDLTLAQSYLIANKIPHFCAKLWDMHLKYKGSFSRHSKELALEIAKPFFKCESQKIIEKNLAYHCQIIRKQERIKNKIARIKRKHNLFVGTLSDEEKKKVRFFLLSMRNGKFPHGTMFKDNLIANDVDTALFLLHNNKTVSLVFALQKIMESVRFMPHPLIYPRGLFFKALGLNEDAAGERIFRKFGAVYNKEKYFNVHRSLRKIYKRYEGALPLLDENIDKLKEKEPSLFKKIIYWMFSVVPVMRVQHELRNTNVDAIREKVEAANKLVL